MPQCNEKCIFEKDLEILGKSDRGEIDYVNSRNVINSFTRSACADKLAGFYGRTRADVFI